ncbi:replicative DNA helicase [Burkholderia cenocepacia]|uniref:replicative DNA helicase n=1 Tax=Burkholderia cenocepacia TaxID=95486 RepID=UPI00097C5331|nr:replicative DNA helicase [Burkholderia cenocepacia]AQQ17775.1 replicative DNA helicase [Burkholderia cenocepacia]ONJ26507.1 replicative DNA helicase [Burkholderia cenocepacia]ONN83866.1 replicative DNA helicase [Burkholderia cenocepacia]ONN87070.1 replicative DNA helicase [Burkholderia cenocepacia]ONN89343.1 replicative DNA helicase [Burkholderia cenocepacia]
MGASHEAEARGVIASVESEQAVLGALMLDNGAYDLVAAELSADDFTVGDHRAIFTAIQHLIVSSRPADVLTVFEQLRSTHAKVSEPLRYLNDLVNSTPTSANLSRYAGIVRSRSQLRGAVRAARAVIDQCHNTNGREAAEIIDSAQAAFLRLADRGQRAADGFQPMQPALTRVVERIDELFHREDRGGITGTPTGFVDLDGRLDGMHGGELIIVGGRPSMGKTSFAMNIAEHVAIASRLPVGVLSLEMPTEQLTMRMLASTSRISQNRLRTGRLEDDDWPRLTRGVELMADAPVHVLDSAAITPSKFKSELRRLYRECGKLGLIVVDYLQLMSGDGGGSEMRATEVAEISRALKQIAKELDVPIVALSQLNRGLENRPNKRPVMSDLRESGAIEQDADVILFIYRDEIYNPDSADRGTAEIIIAKQRNGPIGTVRLAFQNATTRFENFAEPASNY